MREKRLVLDANILIRSVFGPRVRTLLETYEDSVIFRAPDISFQDARKYVAALSETRNLDTATGLLLLDRLSHVIEPVDYHLYREFEVPARDRMRSRDIDDWPIAATALLLDCPIWTEDQDFFGSGIATWTTNNVELYLRDA